MELLTVKDVAAFLKVSSSMVYALVSKKRLNCIRVGLGRGTIRISKKELHEFVARQIPENGDCSDQVGHDQKLKFITVRSTT